MHILLFLLCNILHNEREYFFKGILPQSSKLANIHLGDSSSKAKDSTFIKDIDIGILR